MLGRCLQDEVRIEVVLVAAEEEEAAGGEAGEEGEADRPRAEAQLYPAPSPRQVAGQGGLRAMAGAGGVAGIEEVLDMSSM